MKGSIDIMKQAILIMAHNNWKTLKNLINYFDKKLFDVYLHVDSKSLDSFNENFSNYDKEAILEIVKSHKVNWGGFSQIEAEMELFKSAFNSTVDYSYYHLISGVDFPIQSNQELFDFFNYSYPDNFIGFAHLPDTFPEKKSFIEALKNTNTNEFKHRIDYYYPFHDLNMRYLPRVRKKASIAFAKIQKKLNYHRESEKVIIAKGSNWVSLTNDFVGYLLSLEDDIYSKYKYTYCADEIYKHTIFVNSPFIEFIYFDHKKGKSANKRLIDWNRGTPYIFGDEDIEEVLNNSLENMFVRKLSDQKSQLLINSFVETNKYPYSTE